MGGIGSGKVAKYPERGERFGRWTVLKPAPTRYTPGGQPKAYVACRCACGTVRPVGLWNLRSGRATSCGCYSVEVATARLTRHGQRDTRTYETWCSMKKRCANPNSADFHRYGARGIRVCERWQTFENFLADMGHAPPGMTLERIDNDSDYEPMNCHWSTRRQQAQNTRSNVRVMLPGGGHAVLSEACRLFGISRETIYSKIRSDGISRQQAFDYYLAQVK